MQIRFLVATFFMIFSINSKALDEYILMDDESESFILEIISKIKGALKYDGDINVYILGSQALNAAATQDGDVVINAGAILQCDNVYEFIAIVAHEVGHIEGAHIATFSASQKDFARAGLVTTLIGAAASVVSGSAAPLLAGVFGGQSMGTGMALSKLRQKESIADTKAAQAIKQLQWPVFKGFVSLHRKLAKNSTGIYNVYLLTHPQSQDRIDKCLKFLSEEKGTKVSKEVSELMEKYQRQFETVRHKIRALVMSVEDVLRLYSHPKNSNEKYAKAIALYRGYRYEAAVPIVDELIRQKTEDTDQAYYEEIRAMCLINMKRCSEAAEICWNILKNDRNVKKVHRDLGVIYADAIVEGTLKNHIDNAIKILKKIRIIKREDPSVIEELGKLYAMKNVQDEASLCAAEASLLMNDEKTALIHAKRALRSSNKAVRRRAEDIISSTDKPKHTSIS